METFRYLQISAPSVSGYVVSGSTVPSVTVSGSGCVVGTVNANSNGMNGSFVVTTGGTCAFTVNVGASSVGYANAMMCAPLQDITNGTVATMASNTMSSTTFKPLVVTSGDTMWYGPCTGQ